MSSISDKIYTKNAANAMMHVLHLHHTPKIEYTKSKMDDDSIDLRQIVKPVK